MQFRAISWNEQPTAVCLPVLPVKNNSRPARMWAFLRVQTSRGAWNYRGFKQEEQPDGLRVREHFLPRGCWIEYGWICNKPSTSWRWLIDQCLSSSWPSDRSLQAFTKGTFSDRNLIQKPQNWPPSDKQWSINTAGEHNQDSQPLKTIQTFPRVGGVFICVRAGFAQSAKLITSEKQQLYLFMHQYVRDQTGSPVAAMADRLNRCEWYVLFVCSNACRVPGKVVGSKAAWVHLLCGAAALKVGWECFQTFDIPELNYIRPFSSRGMCF